MRAPQTLIEYRYVTMIEAHLGQVRGATGVFCRRV